ncbi:DUF596 domain-containing protein [Brenneria populi subsp. brevivirga]|uniref:DUF596 domain-containing protein n=1 Tax=Brenneria populi TaxID=1505588 RepID=UPI002E19DCA1|nr:DUF596 domain-containing protein [Brenneria populi subsp. brevivirga]
MLISDEDFQLFKYELEGHSLGSVWYSSIPIGINRSHYTFKERKAFFFELLQRLMKDGKLKLANHDVFLEGTIEEQVTRFKEVFPKTEEEWKKRDGDIWFLDDDCPGGAVWMLDSGYLDWT